MTTPDTRSRILEGALAILRNGDALSLESAARQAGLTKPGLMYHFPTKEALMLAATDHVMDGYERSLMSRVAAPPDQLEPIDRLRAYLEWSLDGSFDSADLVMMADPRVRVVVTERWGERLAPWLSLPADLSDADRARFNALRLIADGSWFADACGGCPLGEAERVHLRAFAETIIGELS